MKLTLSAREAQLLTSILLEFKHDHRGTVAYKEEYHCSVALVMKLFTLMEADYIANVLEAKIK